MDDNGITGPDWGRSEVVFKCFCNKMLPAPESGISLWKVPHSTRLVYALSFICIILIITQKIGLSIIMRQTFSVIAIRGLTGRGFYRIQPIKSRLILLTRLIYNDIFIKGVSQNKTSNPTKRGL